jgi:hypothetical protein
MMIKKFAAIGLSAAIALAPLAAFAEDAAPAAAPAATDAAPAATDAGMKPAEHHKAKAKHHAKTTHKTMMNKDDAPAADTPAPADAPKQ